MKFLSQIVLPLVVLAFGIACTYEASENKELSERLLGEWRNSSLKIEMKTYKNKDTSFTFEVNENNWEAKMNIKPIRTIFRANRTYNSEHYALNDSLIYNPAGKWLILGDTLHMWDTFPNIDHTYKYKVNFKDDLVKFTGIEDCDGDGKEDDLYTGTQKKQK